MDVDSQKSDCEWTLLNDTRKDFIKYQSYTEKLDLIDYHRNGNQWKKINFTNTKVKKNDRLLEILPSLPFLVYVETFKKTCIISVECTEENERSEIK